MKAKKVNSSHKLKNKYTQPLFYTLVVFLKKWAQTKKASTKNGISVRKNKVSGVLKNQAQYARADDKALMCA
jgi:hypothetical protein